MEDNRNDGRPTGPVRKKKYKILWDRVIVAAIVLIVVIVIICVLISALVGAVKNAFKKDDDSSAVKANASAQSSIADSSPESNKEDEHMFTVVIDAGHGGEDIGATDFSETRYEKDDCLRIALLVEKYLKEKDIGVIMTRSEDVYVTLDERCRVANDADAALFVSLHRNLYEGEAQGVEVWVNNSRPVVDTALAQNILDGMKSVGISEDRGVNYGYRGNELVNYQVNRETDMPSCLVEMGFMQDAQDNELFDTNIDAYAKVIAEAIYKTACDAGMVEGIDRTLPEDSSDSSDTSSSEAA